MRLRIHAPTAPGDRSDRMSPVPVPDVGPGGSARGRYVASTQRVTCARPILCPGHLAQHERSRPGSPQQHGGASDGTDTYPQDRRGGDRDLRFLPHRFHGHPVQRGVQQPGLSGLAEPVAKPRRHRVRLWPGPVCCDLHQRPRVRRPLQPRRDHRGRSPTSASTRSTAWPTSWPSSSAASPPPSWSPRSSARPRWLAPRPTPAGA